MSDIESEISRPNGVKLKKAINLQELLNSNEAVFEIDFSKDQNHEESEEEYFRDDCDQISLMNLSDDDDNASEPFESQAKKMVNLTDDGKIKKRIRKEGIGDSLPPKSTVTVDYNAYLEYLDEAYDSTYVRRKPQTFQLGSGEVFTGLDISVASMKLGEKARFLIHPDYAFGELGCLDRIPPNSFLLFDIELKRVVDSGAAQNYMDLNTNQNANFKDIVECVKGLKAKAKELVNRNSKLAIKEYNKAVSLLEKANLKDINEQDQQQELLISLYTNLAVCYNKINEFKKTCIRCNNIYHIQRINQSIQIPAKVYFSNGRALAGLGDFDQALRCLQKAHKLAPNDSIIAQEIQTVERKRKVETEREKEFAKRFMKNGENNDESGNATISVSEEFKQIVQKSCEDLMKDSQRVQFKLPPGCSEEELQYTKSYCESQGLVFNHFRSPKVEYYSILKPN